MLVYISIAYCIVYFMAQFVCVLSNRRVKRIDFCWMLIFFCALIFIGYHLEGVGKSGDLERHYEVVDWYRSGKKTTILPMAELSNLYIYQLICQLVSLQEKNQFLQVIYLLIDFLCILYITESYTKSVKTNKNIVAIYLLVYFTLTPFFYSYSGLRYSSICHIMGVGFYQYYFKNDRLIKLVLLYIISFLIHPATGIYLLAQIWYECTKSRRYLYLVIGLWRMGAVLIASLLQMIPVPIARFAGEKLYFYLKDYHMDADIRLILAQIVFMFSIIYCTINMKGKKQNKVIRLYGIVTLLGLGSGMAMFYLRVMMILGPVLLLYLHDLYKRVRYKQSMLVILSAWAVLLNLYYTITIFSYLKLII